MDLKSGELKKCHICAELIKASALKCKHCDKSQVKDKASEELHLHIKNIKNQ